MTRHPLTLTASLPAPAPARTLTASQTERMIAGLVLEYGTEGYASTGKTIFHAGSLRFPDDASRVKFLAQHDSERPLGVMATLDAGETHVHAAFNVSPGPLGDEALAMAADGRRDGLSVGCRVLDYAYEDDTLHVHAAEVYEVSLVTIPAFRSSLVARASMKETPDMSRVHTLPVELTASGDQPGTPATPAPTPAAPQPATPAPTPAEPAPAEPAKLTAASSAPVTPTKDANAITLDVAAARTTEYLAAGNPASGLTAALTDVVPADDKGEGYMRPQWLGELWTSRTVARPTIDSIQRKQLTSMKVYGFRRIIPEGLINTYAGNKTAVPTSKKITTEPIETQAKRLAGGWDVDRVFIDLGDSSYLRAIYEAAADEYAAKTEAEAVTTMLEAATDVTGTGHITSVLSELGVSAARVGSSLTRIQFGVGAWAEFVDTPTAEVPWWLQKQGEVQLGTTSGNAGGLSFNVNVHLPADAVLAYDTRSATWFEQGPTPIQVQAVDVARGGVDLGVYGYHAMLVNDPRAIFATTTAITEPAG
ncbi:HK97 family phage prohead protease [Micrococcus luteus]|uniref:HK97 family phage prohead protease n=1 Tax=Micrococcus luteus TaxID=1270 RepID=UPI00203FFF09|nr:HK97 family phage prohead protease [Micrococcus luteus]MCM3577445.1 HK97 family phage prohead protease [Micrococcus luteus]